MTYDEVCSYIADIPKFTKKNLPGNTKELMRLLGNPQESFKVIHVAGTNGKGSVCAFLEAILRRTGKRVGLFTSPHLQVINERFQVNRVMIDDESFTEVFGEVRAAVGRMMSEGFFHPTYFEILFAMGMLWFKKEQIDVLVMETGLGGRLDATNVVEHPALCVITSISLDHTEYLGDTIEKIAGEKAGIIKEGVPVVYDARDPAAAGVIAAKAKAMHAPAAAVYPGMAQITEYEADGIRYVLNNRWFEYREVKVPFLAEYQVMNSMLALTALRILDPLGLIPDGEAVAAVSETEWGGRMETAMPGVILDGAHNADGIEQFLRTAERIAKEHPVYLLFAAVSDKDYEEMIREICARVPFSGIVVTQIGGSRSVGAEKFAELFARFSGTAPEAEEDPAKAFKRALVMKGRDGVLFCAGSLYLIGQLREMIKETRY